MPTYAPTYMGDGRLTQSACEAVQPRVLTLTQFVRIRLLWVGPKQLRVGSPPQVHAYS
jgi:hypothetical protein